MSIPKVIAGTRRGKRRIVYARATWAVYSWHRSYGAPFITHPATRYNSSGGVDIDQGFVTRRLLRSEARRLASKINRTGVCAWAFRVRGDMHPGDVGSGWAQ